MKKEAKTTHLNTLYESIIKKLLSNKANFRIIEHKPLFTMEDVFDTLDIKPEQMGKTMLLFAESCGVIAVVVPGSLKVDLAKVAKSISKPRNKVKFSDRKEVESLGISVGAISPFFDCVSKVIVDKSFLSQEMVYCGSGDLGRTISISVEDLIKITSAQVADVVKE